MGDPQAGDPLEAIAPFRLSAAGGFLVLALRPAQEAPADPGLAWLHRCSQQWLAAVCRSRMEHPVLPGGLPADWLNAAPPFPGGEYLTTEHLADLWRAAGDALSAACGELPGGLADWLATGHSPWHLVGRVTFHLAENKRDPDKPFAFLATYTDALSAAGTPQHLPLGRALQTYAAAQDQRALDSILTPVRTAAAASPWVHDLLESRRVFSPLAWQPQDAYAFIQQIPLLEQAGLTVKVPDWWKSGRLSRPAVTVSLDTDKSMLGIGAMLRCHINQTLDGTPLSPEDWDRILNSSSGLLNLRGQWIEIDRQRLGEVMEHWGKVAAAAEHGGLSFHEGMRFLAGYHPGGQGAAAALPETLASWSEVIAGKNLAAALEELRHPTTPPAPPRLRATLRPYQEKGLAWLSFMRRLGLGACLADDMGLGKTLQVIALLASEISDLKFEISNSSPPARPNPPARESLQSEIPNALHPSSTAPLSNLKSQISNSPSPSLLVVPASLIGNWQAEFQKFAPHLRVFCAHPSRTPKEQLAAAQEDPEEILPRYQAVLTTYGLLQRSPALQAFPWSAIILDEAQAIKNAGTAQAKAVKKTHAPWRLALTGTPVENRPGDLWSLFDFLNPGLLGGPTAFASHLKKLAESPTGYAPLRRLIQPYILRRMKTDKSIIADLPDKTEITAACGLSRKQAILYGKLVEQLKRDLADETISPMERRSLVVGYLMRFKQVCNHPSHWSGDGVYAPADSGKFARLAELCSELAERQERVLIFTQFREIIDPLHAYLTTLFKRPGLILHGGTAVKARQQLVEQFQAPDGPPFFILSVKAGGTGLTLTAASHVIHFDRWWNPAVENQATDRAYRIGQKRNVLVHKFVTSGTIEERIDAMIESKKATAAELLSQDGAAETLLTEMSNEALLDFIALDADAALAEV